MTKKWQNIINNVYPVIFIFAIILLWWIICIIGAVPDFMLPSPQQVVNVLISERYILFENMLVSLKEAFLGLGTAILSAFIISVLMDRFQFFYRATYPLLILTQTIPTIAIAPLLVLWLGHGILPKIVLIFITCFFPLAIGLLTGFKSVDDELIGLFKSMGANSIQILLQVKIPSSLDNFFAGLKIAATYSIVGAVISEWLGGDGGLGVYMTRVRKAYAFDKMFAVIFVISILSLILLKAVDLLQKKLMPWKKFC